MSLFKSLTDSLKQFFPWVNRPAEQEACAVQPETCTAEQEPHPTGPGNYDEKFERCTQCETTLVRRAGGFSFEHNEILYGGPRCPKCDIAYPLKPGAVYLLEGDEKLMKEIGGAMPVAVFYNSHPD